MINLGKAEKQRPEIYHSPTLPSDPLEAFHRAMTEYGLDPGYIKPSGEIVRFDTEKRGDKAGWYVFFPGEVCGGKFGDWRSDLKVGWSSKNQGEVPAEVWQEHKRQMAEAEAKRAETERQNQERAKDRANKVWENSRPVDDDHPYLVRKGVRGVGIRVNGQKLVIPLLNPDGEIWNLQYIFPDGKKRTLTYGRKKGLSFTFNGDENLFLCEGYSTGATIHEATNGTVICSIDAGNLVRVARIVREHCPHSQITICADDDCYKPKNGNPGLTKARQAAKEIDADLVVPRFQDRTTKPTDFNDLASIEGLKAVQAQLGKGNQPKFVFVHNAELVENLKPTTYTVAGVLPTNSMYNTFGDSGSLKTFLELDRGLSIAAGMPWHGHATRQGTVFYICGEGQQGIGRRIAAWHIHNQTKARDIPFFVAKTPMQLSDPANVEDVMRAIDRMSNIFGSPELVIIDTLSRNFGDGDENSTKDMSSVIQNLDMHFGNDFCRGLIHHTGHRNKERGRGSAALRAAVDTEFRVSLISEGKVLVECTKQKDAKAVEPMLFNAKEIPLIIEGQKDSSLVIEFETDDKKIEAFTQPIPKTMKKALDLLKDLGGNYSEVDYILWREDCIKKGLYSRTDSFDRAADKMRNLGLIRSDLLKERVKCLNVEPVESVE